MKITPVISATAVLAVLFLVVFERDRLLAFAQVSPADDETATATESEITAPGIRVVAIHSVSQTIDSAIILRGRTEAARQVTVASETSGLVVSDPLRKGAFVEAGDMLCELDPGTRQASLAESRARLAEAEGRVPEAQAGITEAEAKVKEAEINLNATQKLSEDGYASETSVVSAQAVMDAATAGLQRANSELVGAEAGIQAAAAAVATAESEIKRLLIAAPFSGLLETDTAELGSLMQPGSPCATIIQLHPIKLVGFAPESEVAKINLGAPASGRLAGGGDDVQGMVTFVSRSADETTRTFRAEVTVENQDFRISDGQTAEIIVGSDGRNAHLIAQSTLTLDNNGALGVRVITDDNTAQFMPVTLISDTAQGVWVTDLPDAVDIITIGQEFVVDGVSVTPTFHEVEG